VTGSPEIVLLRGKVIVDGDEFLGRAGEGQFVKRARFGEQLSPVGAAAAG
jgi:dihydropyrimidinase